MTFEEAKQYLFDSWRVNNKKGLEALKKALALLGDPQEKLKIIHVSGTNGKGSFCAMMTSVLAAEGYAVGKFTSPHLETFHERLMINDVMISDEDFAWHMGRIADVTRMMHGTESTFSFFEIFTMLAFDYFCEKSVDFVLLEVGIGGRLDATNVIKSPVLTVVMSIGMDHMEILGNTIEEITREEAGIIKENCPVVLYPNSPVVYNIVTEMAKAKNAKIYHGRDVEMDATEISIGGSTFYARHEYFGRICIKLSLMGQYQLRNATCAIAGVAALNEAGFYVSVQSLQKGLKDAKWGGRMEICAENPLIILEGAHNLQGAQAAAENMKTLFDGKQITLLVGILKDKEYEAVVQTLAARANKVVFTKPLYDFKAVPPEVLAEAAQNWEGKEVYVVENCLEALEKAREITAADGVVFCSGSLYLVGDIRKALI